MPFSQEADPRVTRSVTLRKVIRCHAGSDRGSISNNTTVEGDVSVTATESSPGSMTDRELYDSAESLLSAALDIQFEENQELLRLLAQAK